MRDVFGTSIYHLLSFHVMSRTNYYNADDPDITVPVDKLKKQVTNLLLHGGNIRKGKKLKDPL